LPHSLLGYFVVFIGAGVGGVLRFGVSGVASRMLGSGFPYGTMIVNVVGSLAVGLLAGWFAHKSDPGLLWRMFLVTGILGGFTTFSAFSLDLATFVEKGTLGHAILYAGASVGISLAAVFLGLAAIRQLV
jgi:fluoride exporter